MVQVEVSDGILEGEIAYDEYGGRYFSFKGIPYAAPPLGDLRFKAPKRPHKWTGVRSAKEYGPVAIQANNDLQRETIGSEDCLYLNVFSPNIKSHSLLPVMIFIHGGGFVLGSGNDDFHGPDYLVRQGVVIVTFNYRLEVLGFLCLNTKDVPGNAGMKDQVAAFKWVQNNINEFGGDPKNVTIFGISCGGSSVAYHLISPMSKGLFKRAIIQSGTNTCYWSQAFAPRERAVAIAKKFGFESDNDKDLYEFFKSQPAATLVNLCVNVTYLETYKKYWRLYFGVVSEEKFEDQERFFFGDVYNNILEKNNDGVEVIVGCSQNEGTLNLTLGIENIIAQANKFPLEYFVPTRIAIHSPLSKQLEVGRQMRNWYFGKREISVSDIDQIVKYFSLDAFVYEIVEWAKIYAKYTRNKIFFYIFTCKTERNIFIDMLNLRKLLNGKGMVSHADDVFYLFRKRLLTKVEEQSETFKLIDNITKLWTNFAKFGNPTPDDSLNVCWKPYTLEKQDYLDIGNQLVEASGPFKDDIDFWEKIFEAIN